MRADLGNVRRVDDDLAAVGNDRFDLVEALGRGPHVLVLARHESTAPGAPARRGNGRGSCAATSAAACPGLLGRTEGNGVQPTSSRRHDAEREALARDQPGCLVDQGAYRSHPAGADDAGAGDERAQPVGQVDDVLPGDTGEEKYLLPPEKPTTSCGNTGPTTSATSCSATARLMRPRQRRSRPSDSSAIRSAARWCQGRPTVTGRATGG